MLSGEGGGSCRRVESSLLEDKDTCRRKAYSELERDRVVLGLGREGSHRNRRLIQVSLLMSNEAL